MIKGKERGERREEDVIPANFSSYSVVRAARSLSCLEDELRDRRTFDLAASSSFWSP